MEDYRLPAPLVGMLKATNLTGMPNVQTDLRATKISVTITWDLATSAPKKPKKQPAKKKPSETSPPTRNQPPTSQCPPPEIPTLPSPTPATIVRRQVTAPTPSPTAPPVAKKPRREPTSQPVIKPPPTRQPFTGEYQVKAVKANYHCTYQLHQPYRSKQRHQRVQTRRGYNPSIGPGSTTKDRSSSHPLSRQRLGQRQSSAGVLPANLQRYSGVRPLQANLAIRREITPEETNDWNYFCTTGDILLLRPPEAMS